MSRGLGRTQRDILDVVQHELWTVPELADKLGKSQRQIRTAVYALRERELVYTRRWSGGWQQGVSLAVTGLEHGADLAECWHVNGALYQTVYEQRDYVAAEWLWSDISDGRFTRAELLAFYFGDGVVRSGEVFRPQHTTLSSILAKRPTSG